MASTQPSVAGRVIAFTSRATRLAAIQPSASRLTPQDRMQINAWQDAARASGYDRMVIHDRDAGDACEVGNFLSVHCSGQAWSRWGFARNRSRIDVWCCLTGADIGAFATMAEALQRVLLDTPATDKPSGNVIALRPRLGSAA